MLNPVFWLLLIIAAFILWLILSFVFKVIGKGITKVYDHTENALDLKEKKGEEDIKENMEEKKND